jgi:mycofactocin system glycosyltransferase
MTGRRYRLDADVRRHADVVIGGSPLKMFRLTEGGIRVVDRIEAGEPVEDSSLVRALVDAGAIHPTPPTSTFTPADVTTIVPSLGQPEHVPRGAIVVDDGSSPPVVGADVRLDENQGPGAARNAGLALVTTPLVAFVDADVSVPDDWLEQLIAYFDEDRVALVAPRVASAPGGTTLTRYEADNSPLDLGDSPARVRAGTRVSYVPAAAIVCRTDAVRAIGGFDEGLRFGEDVDLAWRLDAAGWWVRYEPNTVVTHSSRTGWAGWLTQRIGYGSSAAPLARRHRGDLAPIRMSGWSLAAWILGLCVHPVAGVTIAAGSAAALVRKLRDLPPSLTFGLAWRGNLHAGEQIAAAIRRVWWPLLAVAAIRSTCARRALLVAALARRNPIGVIDDVAYSIGVWRSMVNERSAAPLAPEIRSWPPRDSPSRP